MKLNKKIAKIPFICAMDGESSSGKSTGAKLISKKYKLNFLSSGLLYRYASFLLIKKNLKINIFFLEKNLKI